MKTAIYIMALFASFIVGMPACAQHAGDIQVTEQNGILVTGDLDVNDNLIADRVFTANFSEDPPLQYYIESPGFSGWWLPYPAKMRFNLLGPLQKWTGSAFSTADEKMKISLNSASCASGNGYVPGILLSTYVGGTWHWHFTFNLQGNGLSDPSVGIYALEMELYINITSIKNSEPFWIVFNNHDSSANLTDASEWIKNNNLSLPTTISISEAKKKPDGTYVRISKAIVTAKFNDCCYVESSERSSGIRVISNDSITTGNSVYIYGTISTISGERVIINAEIRTN